MEMADDILEKVNYKSDFSFVLHLYDCDGNEVGFPLFNWRARFFTPDMKINGLVASCVDGVCTNCFNDNGNIRVVANDHHLGKGRLQVEFVSLLPDGIYPDNDQRVNTPASLGIELVREAVCPPHTLSTSLVLPAWVGATLRVVAPLPFSFARLDRLPGEADPDKDSAYFIREANIFTDRTGKPLPPSVGGYNVTYPDGTVRPSDMRQFICGHTVYRYTGRELVNVAIEQNPNQRLVSRTPSVNAHPGLVYLDRGFIRLPIHSGENRVDLNGLYCQFGTDHIVPLAEAVTGMEVYDAAGEEVNAEIIDNCVVFNIGEFDPMTAGRMMARLSFDTEGRFNGCVTFIGVRYDTNGRKIFYQTAARPAPEPVRPPNLRDVRERNSMEMSGERSCYIAQPGGGYQTELWLKRRHGTGSKTRRVGLGLYKKWRHLRNDRQWRWRRNRWGMLINRNSFLMRMRHVSGNRCSEWAYFHVDLRRFKLSGGRSDITIRPARQVRT